jgi:tRNA A-37 threonylcarbamoyl transferase component Bud32
VRSCPSCGRTFAGATAPGGELQFCPDDGTALAAPTRDPLLGRVIGERYRLDDRLGRGAMGTVYRALHIPMDKPVAVKLLRHELAGEAEAVARFQREARSASRLDHDHCIRVTDFGQTADGLLYLVMELLDGESLSARVARGPLPARLVAAIGADTAGALAHAHEHGVIHRDLKPDNVMLSRRGRGASARTVVKVLDFGLAKIAGDAGTASLTRAGSVFGTPEYMAPEQAEGLALDARTDVYSLGVLLYQLVTGTLPFRSPSVIQILAQQVEEAPEPPRRRRPDLEIPPALDALILRCLEKRPDDRFPDAASVAAALEPMADHARLERLLDEPMVGAGEPAPATTASGIARPGASIVDTAGPRARSPLRLAAAVAVGALAVAGGVAVSLRGAGHHPAAPTGEPIAQARQLLDRGDLDGAERLLAVERAHRDGADLQLLLGEVAQRRGNRLKALSHLYLATRRDPTAAEPHARLASLLLQLGQPDQACAQAAAALRADPANATAIAAAAGCRRK